MNKKKIYIQVDDAIDNLKQEFIKFPGLYLTEEDMRCRLYKLLIERPILGKLYDTKDNQKSNMIHTEVRWYGENGKLKTRTDVVVLDPTDLNTSSPKSNLYSKGYAFENYYVGIELKLRRTSSKDSNNSLYKKIEDEVKRLKDIEELVQNTNIKKLISLVFDKKVYKIDSKNTELQRKFHELNKENQNIEIIYLHVNDES